MQWEAPSKPLAVDDPLLLPEREVHAEIGINWFLDQEIPKGGYARILLGFWHTLLSVSLDLKTNLCRFLHALLVPAEADSAAESLLWEERLGKTKIRTTEGLTTCMELHRGWTIASSS